MNKMKVYLFFREGGWYPLELKDDEEAVRNAELNKGTIMVKNTEGDIIWSNLINNQFCAITQNLNNKTK